MSAYEGIRFAISATGRTPLDAVKMATRVAKNAINDLPTDCVIAYGDATVEREWITVQEIDGADVRNRSVQGYRAHLNGYAAEAV